MRSADESITIRGPFSVPALGALPSSLTCPVGFGMCKKVSNRSPDMGAYVDM